MGDTHDKTKVDAAFARLQAAGILEWNEAAQEVTFAPVFHHAYVTQGPAPLRSAIERFRDYPDAQDLLVSLVAKERNVPAEALRAALGLAKERDRRRSGRHSGLPRSATVGATRDKGRERPERATPTDIYRYAHVGTSEGWRMSERDLAAVSDADAGAVLGFATELELGAIPDMKSGATDEETARLAMAEATRLGEWLQARELRVQIERVWASLTEPERNRLLAKLPAKGLPATRQGGRVLLAQAIGSEAADAVGEPPAGMDPVEYRRNLPVVMKVRGIRQAGEWLATPGEAAKLLGLAAGGGCALVAVYAVVRLFG